jgi:cytoskeletal protein CcmA (bactofilin family)
MWRKDEPQAPSVPVGSKPTAVTPPSKTAPSEPTKPTITPSGYPQGSLLTRLLTIKGEITGQDELLIDGQVHGKICLHGGKLTIGPNGRVTADIEAQEVVVRGEVTGNIKGQDRVQIAATGRATGEINTRLMSIEEGAEVHVRVNLEKEERHLPTGAIGADSISENKIQVPVTEEVSQVRA